MAKVEQIQLPARSPNDLITRNCDLRSLPPSRTIPIKEQDPKKDKNFILTLAKKAALDPKLDIDPPNLMNRYRVLGQNNRFILDLDCSTEVFALDHSENYFFLAVVRPGCNYMQIDVLLQNRGCRHFYFPSFSELFPCALDYFRRQRKNIRVIESLWNHTIGDSVPNDNLAAYLASKRNGLSPEEAAFTTPCGRVYRKHGFTKYQLLNEFSHGREAVIGRFSK